MKTKRLSPTERKKEICTAAMHLFKKKGFIHTTMEDVIGETSLSKGGVYYYYKNTTDILYDLMKEGMAYRIHVIEETLDELTKGQEAYFLATKMVEKIIDDNPYMEVYVQFLLAKKNSPKLESLFKSLQEETRVEFSKLLSPLPKAFLEDEAYDFLTFVLNALIIGSEELSARESFTKNKTYLTKMLFMLLEQKG